VPIDRQHGDVRETGPCAEPEDLPEQPCQRALVTLAEPGDRRVIGLAVRRDDPKRDVLRTAALDHPRRALPTRVGVDEQRDHHRRIMRRATMPVRAIVGVKRRQIHRLDRSDHKPREVILRQPLIQTRRQQKRLLAIAPQEVLRHDRIALNLSDDPPLYATASMECSSRGRSRLATASVVDEPQPTPARGRHAGAARRSSFVASCIGVSTRPATMTATIEGCAMRDKQRAG
jgi:hypothetical protein